jgi:tetratricopeptide (TPR) repeat protein
MVFMISACSKSKSEHRNIADNAWIIFGKGVALKRASNLDKAENIFWELIDADCLRDEAFVQLGLICMDRRNMEGAKSYFTEAIKINHRNIEANKYLGIIHYENGDYHKAVPALSRALDLNEKDSEARQKLGIAYRTIGKTKKAICEFKILLDRDPDNILVNVDLAQSYLSSGAPINVYKFIQKF